MTVRSNPPITVAFSPCPNDIFIFYAWMQGLVGKDIPMKPILADVQTLNEWALTHRYPISKISIGCLAALRDHYTLLPAGAAVGYGCGPKLISKEPFSSTSLADKKVAIPGEQTTAYALFKLLLPPPKAIISCPYHLISEKIKNGEVDCGVIIHETRFTFAQEGLFEIIDLGTLWETEYRLPIPLGGIVAANHLDSKLQGKISEIIQQSLQYAWQNRDEVYAYALQHSQEKNISVIKQHIDLYVTAETLNLSPAAKKSIELLCS